MFTIDSPIVHRTSIGEAEGASVVRQYGILPHGLLY